MVWHGYEMYVYMLKSIESDYRYFGMTDNLHRRLAEHNRGDNKTTKAKRPYAMWILATCETSAEARLIEKQFKTGYGRLKADRMIADGRAKKVI